MPESSIALRLLWKEWSRGWPLLAGGILLSQLAIPLIAREISLFSLDIAQAVLFVLAMALVIRGATLAADERARRSYAGTHFPLHPARGTLFTFFFHLLAAMMLGLGFGWHFAVQTDPTLGTLLVLFLATIYLVSFITSLALSTPAGIVAGLFWTLTAGTAPFYAITPPGNYQVFAEDFTVIWHIIYFAAVTVLAPVSLLPLLAGRGNTGITRRIFGTALLAAVIALMPGAEYLRNQGIYHRYLTDGTISDRLTTLDGALTVKYTITLAGAGRTSTLTFLDYRRQREARLNLPGTVMPVGLTGKEAVILLRQQPGKRRMEFLRWNVGRNTTATLLGISARRDALATIATHTSIYGFRQQAMSLSPDGRFALIVLPACFGLAHRYDLWLIDFDHRQASILRASCYAYPDLSVTWMADHALLSGEELERVDLAHHSLTDYAFTAEGRP